MCVCIFCVCSARLIVIYIYVCIQIVFAVTVTQKYHETSSSYISPQYRFNIFLIFILSTKKNVLFNEMRKIRDEVEHQKNEVELQKKAVRSMRDKVGEYEKVSVQLANSERKYRLVLQELAQLRYVPCCPYEHGYVIQL